MQISLQRKTDLALLAMQALVGARANVPSDELAEAIGTTAVYLPQVMAPLVKTGAVDSRRGPGGGYRLGSGANSLSVLALIEAVEGPVETGTCVLRGGPCGHEAHCALHQPWSVALAALTTRLAGIPVIPDQEHTT